MIAALTLLVGQAATPAASLKAMVETHRRLAAQPAKSFTVSATVQGTQEIRATVRTSGSILRVDIAAGPTPSAGSSERQYSLAGGKFRGFDLRASESIEKPVAAKGTMLQQFESAFGSLPDAVRITMSPAAVNQILGPLSITPGWTMQRSGGEVALRRGPVQGTTTLIRLDSQSRVRQLRIQSPKSTMNWEYQWDSPARAASAVAFPAGTRRVEAFTEMPPGPTYASAAARRVGERLLRANAGLRRSVVTITEPGAATRTLSFGRNQFAQRAANQAFGFDGQTLFVRTRAGFASGPSRSGRLLDRLAANGFQIDPMMRELLARNVPFQSILRPGTRVTLDGTITVDGVACDILKAKSPQFEVSLFVRRDNGLAHSLTSEVAAPGTRVRSTTTLAYRYERVGQSPPVTAFRLTRRPGERAVPLR